VSSTVFHLTGKHPTAKEAVVEIADRTAYDDVGALVQAGPKI